MVLLQALRLKPCPQLMANVLFRALQFDDFESEVRIGVSGFGFRVAGLGSRVEGIVQRPYHSIP